ncbi:MAG: CapA family protein [Butyrivibrio sp.]|nr:CapA family protein [Butyrivibrio sp.]
MKRTLKLSFLFSTIIMAIIYFATFIYIYLYKTEVLAVAGEVTEAATMAGETEMVGNTGTLGEPETVGETAFGDAATIEESVTAPGDDSEKLPNSADGTLTADNEPLPTFEEYDITLMAIGDNLLHSGIIKTGMLEDGSLDYSFLFENIAGHLENADIKVINQETIFAGNELGFLGYPKFNSPIEVGDAIAAAGFNVVLHATNHAADQGIKGINYCMSFWEKYSEILVTGIAGEEAEEETEYEIGDELLADIPMLEIEGVKFAILNYTYGPNSETIGPSLRKHLNMLCNYNEKSGAIDFTTLNPKVIEDIRAAREEADIVIVFPHWGTEYKTTPSAYQTKFAQEMTEAGADLIIGTHPHVPQPVEWIRADNGNRALCYYSLGNYVSLQKQTKCMLEGMAWVTFHVTEAGVAISDADTGVIPLVCQYNSAFRLEDVYFLEDYTEEMAQRHGIRNYENGEVLHLEDLLKQSQETFGNMVLDKRVR